MYALNILSFDCKETFTEKKSESVELDLANNIVIMIKLDNLSW